MYSCSSCCSLDTFGFAVLILSVWLAIFRIKFFNLILVDSLKVERLLRAENKSDREACLFTVVWRGLVDSCSKNVELEHLLSKAAVLKCNWLSDKRDYLEH